MLCASTVWAYPAKGSVAPALNTVKLLQAPAGARTDWSSLKGKVVVLEFWATWCSPCVASLPHFNAMVLALDPAKFAFISMDDEDPKVVQTFLTRKKMAGWVGTDTTGSVFHRYGVVARPTTIVVDANGKVAAVTEIESLNIAKLRAIAAGRSVEVKPATAIIETTAPTSAEAKSVLFSVSVSKAPEDAKPVTVNHPPTGTDRLGEDADSLMADVFNPFTGRYVLKGELPTGRYDLRVHAADVAQKEVEAATQQAVLGALHLQLESKTLTRRVYLLRATEASMRLLSESASTHAAKRGYWHGTYVLMNGTMSDMAYLLGTSLESPVIDETGITGTYDARFTVQGDGVDVVNAVLRKTMGLELVPGDEEMPITVEEVSGAKRQSRSLP